MYVNDGPAFLRRVWRICMPIGQIATWSRMILDGVVQNPNPAPGLNI